MKICGHIAILHIICRTADVCTKIEAIGFNLLLIKRAVYSVV